jgi:hypothetical protein
MASAIPARRTWQPQHGTGWADAEGQTINSYTCAKNMVLERIRERGEKEEKKKRREEGLLVASS